MRLRSGLFAVFLVLSLGLLTGCESSEQKAEKHFQSAMSLLEQGDEERAIVEFKNVFKLNGRHRLARAAFADLQRSRGDIVEAIAQNQLLVEQYPDELAAHLKIAEMYAQMGNWPAMEVPLAAANRLAPEDPALAALQVVYDYRQRVGGDTQAVREALSARASALLEALPEQVLLRQLLIDEHLRRSDFDAALAELDRAIAVAPENRALYLARLAILQTMGDGPGVEAQLKLIIDRFPDDEAARAALVRWYVSQDQLDEAEAYLRDAVAASGGAVEDRLTLIRFLEDLRGREVAIAELEGVIAGGEASLLLRGLRAGYAFEDGDRDGAIAQMRMILDGAEPSEEARKIRIALAQMLERNGDLAGAQALIDEVLAQDRSNVDALKIQAAWFVENDRVGDAIIALRTALEQAPRDAGIMTLLAKAHERDGNQELVGEMLSLALEASDNAPGESMRYASFLLNGGNFATAESVLISALRIAPDHVGLLIDLGDVYVVWQDWMRADQVQERLRQIGTPEAVTAANDLKNRVLQGQQKTDEQVAFLEELIRQGNAGFGAHVEIVRSYLTQGEPEKATQYVRRVLAENPGDVSILFLDASMEAAIGKDEAASAKFRALLDDDPTLVQGWVALYRILAASGQDAAAEAVVDEAIEALPDVATIKWIKAGILEGRGDLDGAIAIYEAMYAADSGNMIIANNLASLLSVARDDAASLERANAIARRLRASDVPPYQDTYGWIAYLRGDTEEALRALEPAAAGMAEDPMVQYHLAKAYLAAQRPGPALKQFQKVVDLVGAEDGRDFVREARAEIARLKALPEAGE